MYFFPREKAFICLNLVSAVPDDRLNSLGVSKSEPKAVNADEFGDSNFVGRVNVG